MVISLQTCMLNKRNTHVGLRIGPTDEKNLFEQRIKK